MKSPFIIPLKEAFDVDLVGGKAINLAKMMQANLPVPDGFVVTTEAFRSAKEGKVSEELAKQIFAAFDVLGAELVAARSSATAEDMAGASMAGQYETYLNIRTPEELIDGIEKCWRSIRSDRTYAYLKEHNIDPDQVAMAVVVQKLIAADVAGVLFTVDPKNACRESMLIEASWGLGESLVSGEVQPDVIVVHSTKEEVKQYIVADKKLAMYPGKKGFQDVSDELRHKACLPYEQIIELQRLGQLAERHFGAPQDIEWAVEAGSVFMLQARPITTLAEVDAYIDIISQLKSDLSQLTQQNRGPWVRHNLGETLPHPTPLTWQLVSHFMSGDGGFGQMHKDLGFSPSSAVLGGQSFLKRIGGEVYMDCALMTEMFSEDYPYAYDVNVLRSNPDAAQNPPTVSSGNMQAMRNAAKQSLEVISKLQLMANNLDKEFDEIFIPELSKWSTEQEKKDLGQLTDDALVQLWREQVEKVLMDFGNKAFMPSMVEALAVEKLRAFLTENVWNDDPAELLSILSVSSIADCTMKANIELSKVAADKALLNDWLSKHGHRAPGEFELATPRWRERPEDVLKLAKQMTGDKDLEEIHHKRQSAAEQCIEKVKLSLNPKHHATFISHVELVQRYCRFREDGKYYLMRAYSVLRTTALEFSRRLELGNKVFFLTQDELFTALQTGFIPKDKIAQRELHYRVEDRIQLPHVIADEDIANLGMAPVREGGVSLQAFSVSNGTCSGAVIIVHHPEDVSEFPDGAILVCPSTDPSWTPLFTNAAGLILERGGSLSHGAVVAREMGLPAIVLDGATEILQDGELITIDANSGRLYRAGAEQELDSALNTDLKYDQIPPSVSNRESFINQIGLIIALLWSIILGAIYLLPENILLNPVMSLIDASMWPLINNFGMAGAVAVVAALFALIPIIMQKCLTDNERLFEGKKRAASLTKEAKKLAGDSPRRKRLEELASPLTKRVLKASMVPLGLILGPMMLIFMWFPERIDPLSWASGPGRMVSIVAEIDGESQADLVFEVPEPLDIEGAQFQSKKLPPIRKELEELRQEWQSASPMDNLPWEVQSAGDHTRKLMLSSLNSFLKTGVPPQKVSWLVSVPETAHGSHPVKMSIGGKPAASFRLVFGTSDIPERGAVKPLHDELKSLVVNYPRSLKKELFWAPVSDWDFGWLGVYLLVYLPLMFIAKALFRVP